MIIKAILYPVLVALLVAGGLLAWLNGAGLLIVAAIAVLVAVAIVRDRAAGPRPAAPPRGLPPEERGNPADGAAHGVAMREVEAKLRESSRIRFDG
jgi:hypothetical protein